MILCLTIVLTCRFGHSGLGRLGRTTYCNAFRFSMYDAHSEIRVLICRLMAGKSRRTTCSEFGSILEVRRALRNSCSHNADLNTILLQWNSNNNILPDEEKKRIEEKRYNARFTMNIICIYRSFINTIYIYISNYLYLFYISNDDIILFYIENQ